MANDTQVTVNSAADIVTAREKGRALAVELGFIGSDLTMIATAISEVARNIVDHAKKGKIMLAPIRNGHTRGISLLQRTKARASRIFRWRCNMVIPRDRD
jgi:serine/threonine-protein kinase RsbT